MHDLAVISKIQKIEPIEGKDRIVLATVENYKSIIQKDTFNVGDKVVYVFYDAILPVKPEYEFLRKRCFSPKWNGFRIKPMKMGGVISEGLVLPIDSLGENAQLKVGTVVTDLLEIRRYDPELADELNQVEPQKKKNFVYRLFYRFKWFRKVVKRFFSKDKSRQYPLHIPKSDETNIEKCFNSIERRNEPWILTEKIEGQATMYRYVRRGNKLYCHSHNFRVNKGNWVDFAIQYDVKNKLKKYCKKHKLKEISISGELIGKDSRNKSIQKNIYGRNGLELYLYNAYDAKGNIYSWNDLVDLAWEIGIPTVPFVEKRIILGSSVDNILKDCEGQSQLADVPREGVVWRTEDSKVHFKAKSRPYKIWFCGNEN